MRAVSAATGVRVGLVGYGSAGRTVHTPLLASAGLTVTLVVTASPDRAAQARADHPGADVVPHLRALLDRGDEVDLVVLASPTSVHVEQARECLGAGLAVVVDKPLGVGADEAAQLLTHRGAGRLTVFQNRRLDAEHLTAQRLLSEGRLGRVLRLERRWERWRPVPKQRWRENAPPELGGGLLLDLHSHLVDSAVQLLGPVTSVYAELAAHSTAAEDDVFVSLRHGSGARSHLGALSLAAAPGPRTRLLGDAGAYVVTSFEGEPSAFDTFADLDEDHCGWLVRGAHREPVRRSPGGHADFYRRAAAWVGDGGPVPVDPADAVAVLRVLDAARRSDREGVVVPVAGDRVTG